MLERKNVDFPLWRKKVDATFLKEGFTPIPKWLIGIWEIDKNFNHVTSKSDQDAQVSIIYKNLEYQGQVSKVRSPHGQRYRLYFEPSLADSMCNLFLMSYMRMLESELSESSNNRETEKEISFWEFIDIEFDSERKQFHFVAHYKLTPDFPNLFSRLVSSAPIYRIKNQVIGKDKKRIFKQDWRPRKEYKLELGVEDVIYMLVDTRKKLIYLGEAGKMINRFNAGHPDIKDWDYYKYNVLPDELAPYRLAVERMEIRDMAALLDNKQNIQTISISEYKLVNRKIDK